MSTFKETPFNIDGERRFPDAVHFYFNGKDFFNDLSYLRRKLCKKRYLLEYEKGEKLISQGERVEYCFFMESGGVISYETVNGKRRIYDFFTGANLLLCSYALYDRPCALDYEARCHTVVYSISLERVQKLFFNDSAFTRGALAQTTRDLLVCQDLLRKSAMRSASWLVSDFLIVMASRGCYEEGGVLYISERFTQHQMADMLFINRITCLNELHRMEGPRPDYPSAQPHRHNRPPRAQGLPPGVRDEMNGRYARQIAIALCGRGRPEAARRGYGRRRRLRGAGQRLRRLSRARRRGAHRAHRPGPRGALKPSAAEPVLDVRPSAGSRPRRRRARSPR